MSAKKASALSDLIRQATASEIPESSAPQDAAPIHQPERPPQRGSTHTVHATAEELAEAFFPGSSIREHAFFPKSLTTHSQHSHSHTHYGFLGGFRPGQWAPSDASQVPSTSPPYGSARGSGGGPATSHSVLHRQPSISVARTSIPEVEGDVAGSEEGSGRGLDMGARRHPRDPSNQESSGPPPGSSWAASWRQLHISPQAGREGHHMLGNHHAVNQQQQQQQQQQHEQGQGPRGERAAAVVGSLREQCQYLQQSHVAQSPFLMQPQLGRRHRAASQQQQQQQQHVGSELTEPLLLDHPAPSEGGDVEAPPSPSSPPPYAPLPLSTAASAGGITALPAAGKAPSAAATAFAGAPTEEPLPGTAAAAAAAAGSGSTLSPEDRRRSGLVNSLVFGVINAVVSMPTLIAYAAIVFKAPMYKPYLDSLCRFFFFSSAVHQLVFVGLSSLPFAIGQVQDVGLIFLSAMASDIALRVTPGSGAAEVALGSSLLTMTISTFVVGLLTVVVARLKLADMVSYVPLPVVGGYLGFVGYFCIAGGTALAAGVQVDTLFSWTHLLSAGPALKLVPTAASIAVLMACVKHVSHPLALPGVLTAIPLAFHAVLWGIGWDLERAQDAGWVMRPTTGLNNCWQLWGLYNLDDGLSGVSLPAMLAQLPKLAGLFLVVCFGSCMDVAAIQSDMPTPLDFNRELMTVGISNMAVGALGAGYTGSYIFSQTVFTMRQGVFNRVNGLTVALVELLVFALPFSVVQYMPNYFFGALLVWFGIEIARDWLILSYRKLSRPEYVLLWATFIAIMNTGLELGIAGGIVMATLYFAYQYAQSQVSSLRQVAARSGRTHMYDTSSTLDLLGRRLAVLRLGGFVFFGSSTGLSKQVLQLAARMLQERAEEQLQHEEWALSAEQQRDGSREASGEYGSGGGGGSRADSLAGPMPVPPPPGPVSASSPSAVPTTTPGVAPLPPAPSGANTTPSPSFASATSKTSGSGSGEGGEGATRHSSAAGAAGAGAAAVSGEAAGVAGAGAAAAAPQQTALVERGGRSVGGGGGGGGGGGTAAGAVTLPPGSDSEGALSPAERHWRAAQAVGAAPVVLILDFSSVTGVDSTAARTFANLAATLASQQVNVVFAALTRPECRALLEANGLPLRPFTAAPPPPGAAGAATAGSMGAGASMNGGSGAVGGDGASKGGGSNQMATVHRSGSAGQLPVVTESPLLRPSSGGCWEFASVSSAVGCCEDAYLGLATRVGLLEAAPPREASLGSLLGRHLREVFPSAPSDLGGLVGQLEGAVTRRQLAAGELLYGAGTAVREVYMIEFGALVEEEHYEGGVRVSAREHGAGVVVGALEFFLSRPAPSAVRCSSPACQLLVVSRATFHSLMAAHPRALAALQVLLLRSTCMDLASAQEAANHAAAVM